MKQVMWTNSAYERVLATQEDKDRFYFSYNNNNELLDTIAEAFKEKIKICDEVVESPETYKDSSWGYRQADAIGYKRALTEAVKLLSIRDRDLRDDRTE